MKLIIGITGASGSIYASRLLKRINTLSIDEIALVITENGLSVYNYEIGNVEYESKNIKEYKNSDFFAPIASGSALYDAMIVCPCTMGTLAKIANGVSDNLLTRAADVMLKEKKRLIIVTRETPLNLIHIENMKKIIMAGGIIMPASPSFYSHPKNITDLVDTIIDRVLKLLNFSNDSFKWGNKINS